MDEVSYSSVGWTAARLARQVEVALAALDLSPAQYRMLVQIARGTDASSSLAQKLAVSARASPPSSTGSSSVARSSGHTRSKTAVALPLP